VGDLLRIQLAGPIRAQHSGAEIPLGTPQQRTVLAMLVLAGGSQVPLSEIIDTLWREDSPPSAVNVVRTYIRRLRQLLEPDRPARHPSQLLPSIGDGYALAVDRCDVDLWRFQAELAEIRRLRRAGTDTAVADRLADLLPQWRGQVATDLPDLATHPRAVAVGVQWRTALGWFAELAPAYGLVTEAVPLLEEALVNQPLDEELHTHLIRLYHAVGQRSDAMRVYQIIRSRVRDELGLDPNPDLTAAYLALLHRPQPVALTSQLTPAKPGPRQREGDPSCCGHRLPRASVAARFGSA
jgi:DNA-binding SARP family transcriptional activator